MPHSSGTAKGSRAAVLIAVILTIGTLYVARDVLIPFALAILFSFLLAPLVTRLQRVGLRRGPAVMIVVAFAFGIVTCVGWLVAAQAGRLAGELPHYRQNIIQKVHGLRASLGGTFGEASKTIKEIGKEMAVAPTTQATATQSHTDSTTPSPLLNVPNEPNGFSITPTPDLRNGGHVNPDPVPTRKADPSPLPVRVEAPEKSLLDVLSLAIEPIVALVTHLGIATVFVIFMLLQREELRDRLIRLVGHGHMYVTTEAITDAAERVSRYLAGQVVVNLLNGTAIAIGLTLIGVPGALLWGLMAALLRFVPFLGPWIAAAMPFLLSLSVFEDWLRPVLVIALVLTVDLTSASFLEPWLYGARVGVSPFAILASTVFWTWLWGGVGLFLATPLTVCLVVMGRYVPQLGFLSIMLGDEPALPAHVRLYQRLLAMDERGVQEQVHETLKAMPLIELYDSLVVPALRELEWDRRRGALTSQREALIRKSVGELIEEVAQEQAGERRKESNDSAAENPPATDPASASILCVPACGRIDRLAAQMLAQTLNLEGLPARATSPHLLTGELIETIRNEPIEIVCICATAPPALPRVRHLSQHLRKNAPELTLIAGLWTGSNVLSPQMARLMSRARVISTTHLAEAVRAVMNTDALNEPPDSQQLDLGDHVRMEDVCG